MADQMPHDAHITACARKPCTQPTGHISGYCSEMCLQLDHDFDAPPVTVLSQGKAGGFGRALHWQLRDSVVVRDAA
jgi:hypothetical protein